MIIPFSPGLPSQNLLGGGSLLWIHEPMMYPFYATILNKVYLQHDNECLTYLRSTILKVQL